MTNEEILNYIQNDWDTRRASEKKDWLKYPERFCRYMASNITRGWAFLLSKDPVKREEQERKHWELYRRIEVVAMEFIQKQH